MMRREHDFERAVRLTHHSLYTVNGQSIFPIYAQDGYVSARSCSYLVTDTKDPSAPSIDGSLGFGVKDFAEGRTSCAQFIPSMTFEQAEAEIERAAKAMES